MATAAPSPTLSVLEICAGAGGQALGLEQAGFKHELAIEIDATACDTLRANRPNWKINNSDICEFDARPYDGIDLVAGGVPCPPFSVAGKQLGAADERDLFPQALRIISQARPRAVMLENVRGLSQPRFANYRSQIQGKLSDLGYRSYWQLLLASEYGVPQLRPRFVLVALRPDDMESFRWPAPVKSRPTVGETMLKAVSANGWTGAERWAFERANAIAPTIVGGSKKHGAPDLGPTRARQSWLKLGVDGVGIANDGDIPCCCTPADAIFKLTVGMGALIQGFPESWQIVGRKTAAWRCVGNAFPPPVARAVGSSIHAALLNREVKGQVGNVLEPAASYQRV